MRRIEKRLEDVFWYRLELQAEEKDVARVLDYDVEQTMVVINHSMHLAWTAKAILFAFKFTSSICHMSTRLLLRLRSNNLFPLLYVFRTGKDTLPNALRASLIK